MLAITPEEPANQTRADKLDIGGLGFDMGGGIEIRPVRNLLIGADFHYGFAFLTRAAYEHEGQPVEEATNTGSIINIGARLGFTL